MQGGIAESIAPVEFGEFQHNTYASHAVAGTLDEARRCRDCATGGKNVVKDEHTRAGGELPHLELKAGCAVFEVVLLTQNKARQLPAFAHGEYRGIRGISCRGGKKETARLDSGDRIELSVVLADELVDDRSECTGIGKNRVEVTKQDTRLRKIGIGRQ